MREEYTVGDRITLQFGGEVVAVNSTDLTLAAYNGVTWHLTLPLEDDYEVDFDYVAGEDDLSEQVKLLHANVDAGHKYIDEQISKLASRITSLENKVSALLRSAARESEVQ